MCPAAGSRPCRPDRVSNASATCQQRMPERVRNAFLTRQQRVSKRVGFQRVGNAPEAGFGSGRPARRVSNAFRIQRVENPTRFQRVENPTRWVPNALGILRVGQPAGRPAGPRRVPQFGSGMHDRHGNALEYGWNPKAFAYFASVVACQRKIPNAYSNASTAAQQRLLTALRLCPAFQPQFLPAVPARPFIRQRQGVPVSQHEDPGPASIVSQVPHRQSWSFKTDLTRRRLQRVSNAFEYGWNLNALGSSADVSSYNMPGDKLGRCGTGYITWLEVAVAKFPVSHSSLLSHALLRIIEFRWFYKGLSITHQEVGHSFMAAAEMVRQDLHAPPLRAAMPRVARIVAAGAAISAAPPAAAAAEPCTATSDTCYVDCPG
eukprot:gene14653-biopygen635